MRSQAMLCCFLAVHDYDEGFIIPDQYNKENAYWADLFTRVKSRVKKIGMDMIYLLIFNF